MSESPGFAAELWSALFTGTSSISDFGHLLEMAFGCSIAYAVLIRAGRLQGDHLEDFCTFRHTEFIEARDLLLVEKIDFVKDVDLTDNKVRCENHVREFRARIKALTEGFAVASIVVAVTCVIALLISGIWDPKLPNWIIVSYILAAFAPTPVGLFWTMYLVNGVEAQIVREYADFFAVIKLIKNRLNEAASKALQSIEEKRTPKKKFFLIRWLFGSSPAAE